VFYGTHRSCGTAGRASQARALAAARLREEGMAGLLDGKVALVTGAGKNIGRAIALQLARDGAAVVVNGRSDRVAIEAVAAEITAAGGTAMAHLADVSDPAAVAAMVEAVAARLGGIDIAVSNAGLRRQTPFLEIPLAEWREILSVALDGAFILAQAVLPQMIGRGGGAFIGLSGISTHIGTPNRAHVSASKSGLEGLVRALAVEFAPHGIRCNCVAPGAIDTVRGASAGALPGMLADRGVPLRRKGSVEEIAAVVRLLAGPEGGYITGQTVHVNGGAFLT
jgi:3-oxoacyl-[acyl-carrier protein] reductase